MSELVRVTFPGVEGQPLVPAKRAALMVARGWSVVDDETPKPRAKKATAPRKPRAKKVAQPKPSPTTSGDNPSPEKPDSRAESHTNKEK